MPRAEREKGRRRENQIVKTLKGNNIDARRISRPYISSDDLEIYTPHTGVLKGEVKARAKAAGWRTIKKWRRDSDLLFLIEDFQKPLVVLDFDLFTEILVEGTPLEYEHKF